MEPRPATLIPSPPQEDVQRLWNVMKNPGNENLSLSQLFDLMPRTAGSYESMWETFGMYFMDVYQRSTPPVMSWEVVMLKEEVTDVLEKDVRITKVGDGVFKLAPEGSPFDTISWKRTELKIPLNRMGLEVKVSIEEIRDRSARELFRMRTIALYEAFVRTLKTIVHETVVSSKVLMNQRLLELLGRMGKAPYEDAVRRRHFYWGILNTNLNIYAANAKKQEEAALAKIGAYTDVVYPATALANFFFNDYALDASKWGETAGGGIENAAYYGWIGKKETMGLNLKAAWQYVPENIDISQTHNLDYFTRLATVGGYSFIEAKDPGQKIMLINGSIGRHGEIKLRDTLDYIPEFEDGVYSRTFRDYAQNYRDIRNEGLFAPGASSSSDPFIWVDEEGYGHVAEMWGDVDLKFRSLDFDKYHIESFMKKNSRDDILRIERMLGRLNVLYEKNPTDSDVIALAYATAAASRTIDGGTEFPRLDENGHLFVSGHEAPLGADYSFEGEGGAYVWRGPRLPWGYSTIDCAYAIKAASLEGRTGSWDPTFVKEIVEGVEALDRVYALARYVYGSSVLLKPESYDTVGDELPLRADYFSLFNNSLFDEHRLRLWVRVGGAEEREEVTEAVVGGVYAQLDASGASALRRLMEHPDITNIQRSAALSVANLSSWKGSYGEKYAALVSSEDIETLPELPVGVELDQEDFAYALYREVLLQPTLSDIEKVGVLRLLLTKLSAANRVTSALATLSRAELEGARRAVRRPFEGGAAEEPASEEIAGYRKIQMSLARSFFERPEENAHLLLTDPERLDTPIRRVAHNAPRENPLLRDVFMTNDLHPAFRQNLRRRLDSLPYRMLEQFSYKNLQYSEVNLESARRMLDEDLLCPIGNVMLARPFARFFMSGALWFKRGEDTGAILHSKMRLYNDVNVDSVTQRLIAVAEIGCGIYLNDNLNYQPDVAYRSYEGGLSHRFMKNGFLSPDLSSQASILAVCTGCEFGRAEAAMFEEMSLLGTHRLNYPNLSFSVKEQELYTPQLAPYLPNATWITYAYNLSTMLENYVDFLHAERPDELRAMSRPSLMLSSEQTWTWNVYEKKWEEKVSGRGPFERMNVKLEENILNLWNNSMSTDAGIKS